MDYLRTIILVMLSLVVIEARVVHGAQESPLAAKVKSQLQNQLKLLEQSEYAYAVQRNDRLYSVRVRASGQKYRVGWFEKSLDDSVVGSAIDMAWDGQSVTSYFGWNEYRQSSNQKSGVVGVESLLQSCLSNQLQGVLGLSIPEAFDLGSPMSASEQTEAVLERDSPRESIVLEFRSKDGRSLRSSHRRSDRYWPYQVEYRGREGFGYRVETEYATVTLSGASICFPSRTTVTSFDKQGQALQNTQFVADPASVRELADSPELFFLRPLPHQMRISLDDPTQNRPAPEPQWTPSEPVGFPFSDQFRVIQELKEANRQRASQGLPPPGELRIVEAETGVLSSIVDGISELNRIGVAIGIGILGILVFIIFRRSARRPQRIA
jgi:hypothetical protein